MISRIICQGTEAELSMAQNVEEERKTGVRARIYKSRVTDIFDNDELELAMPVEDGKPVMLPIGMRFEFVFYGREGLYRTAGIISERYKANNRYVLRVSLKSPLHRFRRQEYCCIPCNVGLEYYAVTKEQALESKTCQYQELLERLREGTVQKRGAAVVISGDGVRFVSGEENPEDSYIMMQFQLSEEEDAKIYVLPAYILTSAVSEDDEECFVTRAEFIMKDRDIREEIIRYIFDEERKNRNRERSSDAL